MSMEPVNSGVAAEPAESPDVADAVAAPEAPTLGQLMLAVEELWPESLAEEWDEVGIPDRGALPGRTREEVVTAARKLTTEDLRLRFRRAKMDKRRFLGLRRTTEEILSKIRYLNQVAVSMRAGLLDVDGAAQEIGLTERQLHDLIDHLRAHAGIEE